MYSPADSSSGFDRSTEVASAITSALGVTAVMLAEAEAAISGGAVATALSIAGSTGQQMIVRIG